MVTDDSPENFITHSLASTLDSPIGSLVIVACKTTACEICSKDKPLNCSTSKTLDCWPFFLFNSTSRLESA